MEVARGSALGGGGVESDGISQRKWVPESHFVINAEEALQYAALPSWRRGSRCVCVCVCVCLLHLLP